ncbi:MAG: hypothetical protein HYZ73_04295 [Elusimicrobia bacterium]|nr:hypothetical protein [Elusimicrobiota bacterium]
MTEPIYCVGRLLALADNLHFHYCKFVRTSEEKRKKGQVDAPTELLGNTLFNFALDSPVAALARLAERIRPYQGWATTYCGEEGCKNRWLLHLMAECERQIEVDTLQRLSPLGDIHKAQLLLGYLADLPKSDGSQNATKE